MSVTRIPPRAVAQRCSQRGLSLIGLLAVGAVIVFAALLVLKVVPSALEYNAIRGAITKVVTSGASSPQEIVRAFDRYAEIDDIKTIGGKDLLIEKLPDGRTAVSFQYEKRIPLFGPASLIIDYHGGSQ